jgi:hypothetical protein
VKLNNPHITWGENTVTLKGVDTQYGTPIGSKENVVTLRYSAIQRVELNRCESAYVQLEDVVLVFWRDDGDYSEAGYPKLVAENDAKCCELAAELARRVEASR